MIPFNWKVGLAALSGWIIIILSIATWHYRDNYRQALSKQQEVEKLAESRLDTINAIQRQQKEVAALDAKYTQELTDARLENDRLRADVAAGRRQLRIKGTCSVSKTATGASMGNGSAIEVSREAGSTVLDIRSGMISDQRKLQFLQAYLKGQCQ
ncbi:lysis protein [Serratia symbiotica]|uniref:lysis protein n=1 Tax=Serratia symbiotica TaxID=138074 RepID=UPI001CF08965|nr:lysis protein [Serratia symbiotica]